MAVYIAADNPLPLIEWQEDVTFFCVYDLSDDELAVRGRFTKPFVAHLGAYTGCSCGFSYGWPIETEDDKREDAWGRESVRLLSEYVSELVKNSEVELFSCWEGDQETEPEEKLMVSPDFFGGEEFDFKEKQFLKVVETQSHDSQ